MAEVTYLLGAGASAQRIPVVNKMTETLTEIIKEFDQLQYFAFPPLDPQIENNPTLHAVMPELKRDLLWIRNACEDHYSIDTFAKKLFLTDQPQFERLKFTLSCYFTYIQIKDKPDKRYDNFWASILTRNDFLPKKIKILSWNYDFQLEQSFINMSNCQRLSEARERINLRNWQQSDLNTTNDGFGIVKLNGSAIVLDNINRAASYLADYNPNSDFKAHFKTLVEMYNIKKKKPNLKTDLSFAWETNIQPIEEKIRPVIERTEVLVVIGYSFPFFNREIDSAIIGNMKNLRTIYIQDISPTTIEERLVEIVGRGKLIRLNEGVDQFLFPKELEVI